MTTRPDECLPGRRRRLRRLLCSPGGLVGLALVVVVVMVAALAPWISPHDPARQNLALRLRPPAWLEGGGAEYLLGTDHLGRDVFSRVIAGSRVSLTVGLAAAFLSALIGVPLGLAAGYAGGWLDGLLSRIADIQQAVPFLVLAIAVAALLGPGLPNLVLVLAITTWVTYFRVVRGQVLSAREEQYVWAARSIGCSAARIAVRHILPNILAPIIVIVTLQVANMIIFEASLSFLGLGVPSNVPTWGRSVAGGREYLANEWWISFFPGLSILLTVMGINLLGDWLGEVLNPKG